jgi:hypothetical protein
MSPDPKPFCSEYSLVLAYIYSYVVFIFYMFAKVDLLLCFGFATSFIFLSADRKLRVGGLLQLQKIQ